jgi:hypothetical protein
MNRIGRSLGLGAGILSAACLFAGCGGDDEGSPSRGGSFSSIQSAIESPTGTVDETTAAEVGVEFEKVASVDVAAGSRRSAQTAQSSSASQDCADGGSISASGTGTETSGQGSITYDSCCVTPGCCIDGKVDVFYSSEQSAPYLTCGSYDLSYSCDGTTADLTYEGCVGRTGEQLYVIEVDGATYTVSGSYADGSGTLEIRGVNGTWSCTYSDASGSCSGSSGDFDF